MGPTIDAVALCTPPQVRQRPGGDGAGRRQACACWKSRRAPPWPRSSRCSLPRGRRGARCLPTWHSRYAPAVEPARQLLAGRADQFGPDHLEGRRAGLASRAGLDLGAGRARRVRSRHQCAVDPDPYPAAAPVRHLGRSCISRQSRCADRRQPCVVDAQGLQIAAEFDFRQTGPQSWDIEIETDGGPVTFSHGGRKLRVGDRQHVDAAQGRISRRSIAASVELAVSGDSDVDLAPLQLVADAFLLGRRRTVEPFED